MDNSEEMVAVSFIISRMDLLNKTLSFQYSQNTLKDFKYEVSLEISTEPEARQNIHIMTVNVTTDQEQQPVLLGSVTVGCTFDILNFSDVVVNTGSTPQMPPHALYLLNSVVIGTMRGVMFSEFRGTYLHNAVLPVLDPTQFIPSDN